MKKTSKKLNKRSVNISEEYMEYLKNYDWPGNIRELENIIELLVNSEVIQMNLWNEVSKDAKPLDTLGLNVSLEQVEKQHISQIMKSVKGNITLAAKILEVGRNTLYRKIEKYNINCSEIERSSIMEQYK
jgi:transcriptional regulator of acetoin/glycerol metabolism